MIARSIAIGFGCATLTLVTGCGAGTSKATVASQSTHSPTPAASSPAQHAHGPSPQALQRAWSIIRSVHRNVAIGVPHTDVAHAPHFDTPEAAMRYLAAAWNANDLEDLKHVTDPSARDQLNEMHSEATRLALARCIKQPAGDYQCLFTHEFPNARVEIREDKDRDGIGHAQFLVGPADRPGWYMTVFQGCGG